MLPKFYWGIYAGKQKSNSNQATWGKNTSKWVLNKIFILAILCGKYIDLGKINIKKFVFQHPENDLLVLKQICSRLGKYHHTLQFFLSLFTKGATGPWGYFVNLNKHIWEAFHSVILLASTWFSNGFVTQYLPIFFFFF